MPMLGQVEAANLPKRRGFAGGLQQRSAASRYTSMTVENQTHAA